MIVRTETIDSRIETWLNENNPDKIVVVVSQTSKLLCLPKLQIHLKLDNIIYEVPDGDDSKTIGYCQDLWEVMLRNNVSRNSLVIAVGGGAVLDFAGFCASVYMRGIPCMYVPTTLLSMVDGSEGGKTGINFYGTKNIIGTFTQPVKILRNVDFLPTLPQFEVLAGWAEIIKHAIISNVHTIHVRIREIISPYTQRTTGSVMAVVLCVALKSAGMFRIQCSYPNLQYGFHISSYGLKNSGVGTGVTT